MKFTPYDYQNYAIDYIVTHPIAAVLLDAGSQLSSQCRQKHHTRGNKPVKSTVEYRPAGEDMPRKPLDGRRVERPPKGTKSGMMPLSENGEFPFRFCGISIDKTHTG